MRSIRLLMLALLTATSVDLLAQELSEHLQPLQPLLDKTWVAPVGESENGQPIFDVARWERALNGQAVRILHSVNQGDYGGETLIYWDNSKQSLAFHYFTTAEFFTTGAIRFEDDRMVSDEEVQGNEDGITQVQSSSQLQADGRLRVVTRMLKQGEWGEESEMFYTERPGTEVIFR